MPRKIILKTCLILILARTLGYSAIAAAQEIAPGLDKSIGLSLAEVSQLALENNLDIQIAKYDAYIKRNDYLDAVSIFDTILSGSFSFTDDQTRSSSIFSGTKSTTHDYKFGLSKKIPSGTSLGIEFQNTRSWSDSSYASVNPAHDARIKLSISQPIGKNFFGLIDRGNIKITKLDIANSDYTSLNRIESDLADIQKAFWKLNLVESQKAIKEGMLKKAQELYAIYKDKHQIGLVEDPGLFAAQANVNIRKNELLISQEQVKIAKNELLLKLNEEDLNLNIYPREGLSVDTGRIDLVSALKDAVEKSRDYLKAKNDLEAKNIKLEMKKNSLWPEIDIEASFIRNGISQNYSQAWESIADEDNPQVYLGVKFSLPLENRQAKGEFESARLEKAKYILLLKKVEREILTQLNNRVMQVNTAIERVATNQEIVELQDKKLKAEERRFQFGRSSSDLLIRYQEDLLEAQLALVNSLYEYKIALIDLKLAQNALLDEYWKEEL